VNAKILPKFEINYIDSKPKLDQSRWDCQKCCRRASWTT